MKSKLKTIVGILLMPLVFFLFICDRTILALLFWTELPSMRTWMVKEKLMMTGFWRVMLVALIWGVIELIRWCF